MTSHLVFLFLVCVNAFAFLPGASALISRALEGRKPEMAIRLRLHHKISLKGDRVSQFDETLYVISGQTVSIVTPDQGSKVLLKATSRGYTDSSGTNLGRQSAVVLTYLLGTRPEQLQNALIDEKFIQRDQLSLFKGGVAPEGDPRSWSPRTHYLQHENVFLKRLPQGPAITFAGGSANNQRNIYFFNDTSGVARVEWIEKDRTFQWDINSLRNEKYGTRFPSRMKFLVDGVETIDSHITDIAFLEPKKANLEVDTQRASSKGPVTDSNLQALKMLLSLR